MLPRLYDVVNDPREQTDLFEEHPDVAVQLTEEAMDWYDALPKDTPSEQPAPVPRNEEEANRIPLRPRQP